jgi:hypothetical protein
VRLDVAVDHAHFVSVLESDGRLADVLARLGERQRAALVNDGGEVGAVDEFHREEMHRAGLLGVIPRDDVRVRKFRRRPHLAAEPLDRVRTLHELRIDELDRHRSIHQPMLGPIDAPHPTAADQFDDAVARMIGKFRRQFVGSDRLTGLRHHRRFGDRLPDAPA